MSKNSPVLTNTVIPSIAAMRPRPRRMAAGDALYRVQLCIGAVRKPALSGG